MVYDLMIGGNLLSIRVVDGDTLPAFGVIEKALPKETCSSCGDPFCANHCDGSQGADENNEESEEAAYERARYNAYLDALESIVLAHVCAGVKVDDPKYVEGLVTALDSFSNQF
jgi:hypothetical protein